MYGFFVPVQPVPPVETVVPIGHLGFGYGAFQASLPQPQQQLWPGPVLAEPVAAPPPLIRPRPLLRAGPGVLRLQHVPQIVLPPPKVIPRPPVQLQLSPYVPANRTRPVRPARPSSKDSFLMLDHLLPMQHKTVDGSDGSQPMQHKTVADGSDGSQPMQHKTVADGSDGSESDADSNADPDVNGDNWEFYRQKWEHQKKNS